QFEKFFGACHVDFRLETNWPFEIIFFLQAINSLPSARGRARQNEIEVQSAPLKFASHPPRRFPTATIEWAVEVVERPVVPTRLGVAHDRETLHSTLSMSSAGCE